MTEQEKRLHRACFTGHRPEKLTRGEKEIKKDLKAEIIKAAESGIDVFISGMARGVDIWGAQAVLELRKKYKLKLICACPFKGFEEGRSSEGQQEYRKILKSADKVEFISESYSPACFQKRNIWMVDRSAAVIAVFNGERGGTKNTLRYAKKSAVPIFIIEG